MHVHLLKRGEVSATFIAILLAITLITNLLPRATAISITSIDPESGHVGDIVRVVGEIDTSNGTYTIFFGEEEVKNGTAVETVVNDTFTVPDRPLGNYNVTLQDATTKNNYTFPTSFAVETAYYIKAVAPQPPEQLQEGELAQILVNVTGGEANTVYSANITVIDPSGAVYYNDTLRLTNSTDTGYGGGEITYPIDFSLGANTDYVGAYTIAFNGTLATGNFTVGLTDKTEYQRMQTVNIQGSGYHAFENVTINITIAEVSVAGYPRNRTADEGGLVINSWAIPADAKPGIHTVTLINATSDGTVKTPADAQNFTVSGAVCLIQTLNLADPPEPLADVTVEARNATTHGLLGIETTNKTGWAEFWLELGNYTFEAYFMIHKNFTFIGSLQNQSIAETTTYNLNLTCQLSHIKITVHDEAKNPLPFINVTLTYTYVARFNQTVHRIESYETNSTGTLTTFNTIANVSYEIEARRYGHLFNRTLIENLTSPLWVNMTCPTYTMFVHVLDSKDLPIRGTKVDVIEWSSEVLVGSETTNDWGSVIFDLTFGRYKIRVYNSTASSGNSLVLNETVVDLIEDQFFMIIHCKICNLDLFFLTIDYFGQPIPNAVIKVECNGVVTNLKTGENGTASLDGILGGECRFSVYILGKLSQTRTLYLDKEKEIVFRIDRYIVLGGHPLEIIQFIALVSLSILVAIFALAQVYRRISIRRGKKEEESSAEKEE